MNLREISKQNYSTQGDRSTHQEIQTGCLQRIADSLELVSKNYATLIREKQEYQDRYNNAVGRENRAYRRMSAMRGAITKLKKKCRQ